MQDGFQDAFREPIGAVWGCILRSFWKPVGDMLVIFLASFAEVLFSRVAGGMPRKGFREGVPPYSIKRL